MPGESKGWYASLIDGVVRMVGQVVAPILAYFAGRRAVEAKETKEALADAEDRQKKTLETERRRRDDAARDSVRERFRDRNET